MMKSILLGCFALASFFLLAAAPATRHHLQPPAAVSAGSPSLVLSQVYGGGGGEGYYLFDYVELFNRGPDPVGLTGWSLQYGSATGNFGATPADLYLFPVGTVIQPGKYFFVQLGIVGSKGKSFPLPPDLETDQLLLSPASGKVALVNSKQKLGCGSLDNPCSLPHPGIIDLVAYGEANNAEGGKAVWGGEPLTDQDGSVRKQEGCQDTDDNNADFDVLSGPDLSPRNSSVPPHSCPEPWTDTPAPTLTETPTGPATATVSPTPAETSTPTPSSTETPEQTATATATPTVTPLPRVYINEFLPWPYTDWNGLGGLDDGDEWIELFNASSEPLVLQGWKLDATHGNGPFIIQSRVPIQPGDYALFYRHDTDLALADDGAEIALLRPDDSTADRVSYDHSYPDRSYSRSPDGGDTFSETCPPSPERSNCLQVPTPFPGSVVLNEFLAHPRSDWNGDGTADTHDEWIELYNSASAPADISGWLLDDSPGGSKPYRLPPDTRIGPRAFRVLYASETGLRLNDDGDTVRLLHSDDTSADQWSYGRVKEDAAIGRRTDGAGSWDGSCFPTPGLPNCSLPWPATGGDPPGLYDIPRDFGAVSIATVYLAHVGSTVLVGGVVTAPPGLLGARDFWLQDESGGVHVHLDDSAGPPPDLSLWANATAHGQVVSYFGEREVLVTAASDIGIYGTAVPLAPRLLGTGQITLADEGQLIETAGQVTRMDGRSIYLDDGTGELRIYLTALTGIPVPDLSAGAEVTARGILRRYRSQPELHPRFQTDLVLPQTSSTSSVRPSPRIAHPSETPTGTPTATAPATAPASPVPSATPSPERTRLAARSTLAPAQPRESMTFAAQTVAGITSSVMVVGAIALSLVLALLGAWVMVERRGGG